MSDELAVVVSCDAKIVHYLPVLQASLYKNHPHNAVTVYVLHMGLSEVDLAPVISVAARFGQRIEPIRVDPGDAGFDRTRTGSWPVEAFLHFFAYKYLPVELDRAMYLDIDTLCDGDLRQWYSAEFDDCFYIACTALKDQFRRPQGNQDDYIFWERSDIDLDIARRGVYVNSGVLLMNLKKMRQANFAHLVYQADEEIVAKLGMYIKVKGKERYYMADQGLLNYGFLGWTKVYVGHDINARSAEYLVKGVRLFHFITHMKPWSIQLSYADVGKYFDSELGFISANNVFANELWWSCARELPESADLVDGARAGRIRLDAIQELHHAETRLRQYLDVSDSLLKQAPRDRVEVVGGSWNAECVYDANVWNRDRTPGEGRPLDLCLTSASRESWVLLPVDLRAMRGKRCRFTLKLRFSDFGQKRVHVYLTDSHDRTKHLIPGGTLPSNEPAMITGELQIDRDYLAVAWSSSNFDVGEHILFDYLAIDAIGEREDSSDLV